MFHDAAPSPLGKRPEFVVEAFLTDRRSPVHASDSTFGLFQHVFAAPCAVLPLSSCFPATAFWSGYRLFKMALGVAPRGWLMRW